MRGSRVRILAKHADPQPLKRRRSVVYILPFFSFFFKLFSFLSFFSSRERSSCFSLDFDDWSRYALSCVAALRKSFQPKVRSPESPCPPFSWSPICFPQISIYLCKSRFLFSDFWVSVSVFWFFLIHFSVSLFGCFLFLSMGFEGGVGV